MSAGKRAAEAPEAVELPPVVNGEIATVTGGRVLSKQTRAPALYTEASLLADMENAGKFVDDPAYRKVLKRTSGLGTSATQASIIEGLKTDGLMRVDKRNLVATEKGRQLIGWLPPEACSVARTAQWETELALIEKTGDSAKFLAGIVSDVRQTVAALKSKAPPPALSSPPSGAKAAGRSAASADGKQFADGSPTPKMLAWATDLAQRAGIKLPAKVSTSFEACRKFIDKQMEGAPPSEKALSFADAIAKRRNIKVPAATLKSASKLSAWIKENNQ